MTTHIYVFRRADGTYWAEFSQTSAKRQGEIVHTHLAETRGDHEEIMRATHKHASERVRALAERALDEMVAANKAARPVPPKTQVYRAPVAPREPAPVHKPGFWHFLRWVIGYGR